MAEKTDVESTPKCSICGKPLDVPDDPLSLDCGGDCWRCVGAIEADAGYPPSVEQVAKETAEGLRPALAAPLSEEEKLRDFFAGSFMGYPFLIKKGE